MEKRSGEEERKRRKIVMENCNGKEEWRRGISRRSRRNRRRQGLVLLNFTTLSILGHDKRFSSTFLYFCQLCLMPSTD